MRSLSIDRKSSGNSPVASNVLTGAGLTRVGSWSKHRSGPCRRTPKGERRPTRSAARLGIGQPRRLGIRVRPIVTRTRPSSAPPSRAFGGPPPSGENTELRRLFGIVPWCWSVRDPDEEEVGATIRDGSVARSRGFGWVPHQGTVTGAYFSQWNGETTVVVSRKRRRWSAMQAATVGVMPEDDATATATFPSLATKTRNMTSPAMALFVLEPGRDSTRRASEFAFAMIASSGEGVVGAEDADAGRCRRLRVSFRSDDDAARLGGCRDRAHGNCRWGGADGLTCPAHPTIAGENRARRMMVDIDGEDIGPLRLSRGRGEVRSGRRGHAVPPYERVVGTWWGSGEAVARKADPPMGSSPRARRRSATSRRVFDELWDARYREPAGGDAEGFSPVMASRAAVGGEQRLTAAELGRRSRRKISGRGTSGGGVARRRCRAGARESWRGVDRACGMAYRGWRRRK